jgi:hypothetical protein
MVIYTPSLIYLLFYLLCSADPKGIELKIPDCCEGRQVTPLRIYFGGHEGVGEYIWYRTKIKLEGSALLNISSASDIVMCGTEQYVPTYFIVLYCNYYMIDHIYMKLKIM